MIQLYTPVKPNCENFTMDDVPVILQNLEEYLIPYIANKDEYPIPRIDIQLCQWIKYKEDTYLTINLLVNLEDINDYQIRISEGFYCDTNKCIIDTDGFLDIKSDEQSISHAIIDIYNKMLPLRNRDKNISIELYPYALDNAI